MDNISGSSAWTVQDEVVKKVVKTEVEKPKVKKKDTTKIKTKIHKDLLTQYSKIESLYEIESNKEIYDSLISLKASIDVFEKIINTEPVS